MRRGEDETTTGRTGHGRHRRGTAVAVVLALVLAAGTGWWWQDRRRSAAAVGAAQEHAEQVAQDLAAGRPPSLDGAPSEDEMGEVLEGMGEIAHTVTAGEVSLDDDARRGTVTIEHTWRIHEDKQPWTYETTLAVRRDGERWSGTWEPGLLAPDLEAGEGLQARRLSAERGEVLGDGGRALVADRAVVRVGVDRSQTSSLGQARRSAREVAELVDVEVGPFVDAVEAAGPQAFVEAIVLRAQAPELDEVSRGIAEIPGARGVEDTMPLAPTSTFARAVLGSVGPATAEQVEGSKGAIRAGDVVGTSGLQLAQDDRLRGTAGYVVEAVDLEGSAEPRELRSVPAVDGRSVRTTLSQTHQGQAEAVLEDIGPPSAVVAIRPSDGHVLAAASGPGSEGTSTATLGQYAPGSTFKTVTALALLRSGITPQTRVPCTTTTTVEGRSFTNYDDYPSSATGDVPLATAFASSCNTALISQRDRLGDGALDEAAEALGLTLDPSLGVPAELGDVPDPKADVDLAAATIGQGTVLATPTGMATVAASVAKGAAVSPVLVLDGGSRRPASPARPLTAAESKQLRSLMRGVVTDGSARFLADVPGGPVRAKTGTAEYGSDEPPRTHAWMIGTQGDLAVAVFVADGPGGASTAGPVLEDYLRRLQR
ncbi:penicillin-binding transpeptidase domain-containing protein [Janibacter sp. UYMM211]|uniref:penicillin-binding transpeptidase domain-containing protein n=1 Tax=Janibacter sp. UYMM211 TaxID=3156342 RepID=UPI003392AB78